MTAVATSHTRRGCAGGVDSRHATAAGTRGFDVDIGQEMRRYRAEPVDPPVPGEAPAVREPATDLQVPARIREPARDETRLTQDGVAQARS